MTRKLKVFGLVLVAIYAMGAVGASAAVADFTTTAGATITGEEATQNKFTITGQLITCSDVTFHATATEATQSHITLSPRYTECKTNLGTTMTMTGFGHLASEAGKPKCGYTISTTGTFALECEAGAEVTTDAGPCVAHLPAQHFASGVAFTTGLLPGGIHDLLLHFNITGITATHTDGFLCPFGSSGHNATTVLEGSVTLRAEVNGVPVNLTKDPL